MMIQVLALVMGTALSTPFAIENTTVHVGNGEILENTTVVIADGKIKYIGKEKALQVAQSILGIEPNNEKAKELIQLIQTR